MTPASPRCGLLMQRWRENPGWPPVLDPPVCGRPGSHPGRCRSETAMEMARRRRGADAPSGSAAVAEAIRQGRLAAGLSRRRLASLAGVTEACVQHYEAARRTPSPETWVQLELTLGPLGVVRDRKDAATREDHAEAA